MATIKHVSNERLEQIEEDAREADPAFRGKDILRDVTREKRRRGVTL